MTLSTKNEASSSLQATAGMRGVHWNEQRMARPYRLTLHQLRTADGQQTTGYLYSQTGNEKSVVCIMHPRELGVTHYLVPDILDAGYACWIQGARSVGNDLRLEHETALFDVATGMTHLHAAGFSDVVLLGNSGGAALYGLYTQQAGLSPERRIATTPAGRPTKLDNLAMPLPSRLVFLSPHPGPGALLMACIDASADSETDPFSTVASLNPFSKENGYDVSVKQSKYATYFVANYRLAQRERVARIDAFAHSLLERKANARKALKNAAPDQASNEKNQIEAAFAPIFQVWRTDADLRSWDTSIDSSDRKTGSLWGNDPIASNYGSVAFGRVVTPESWLSTWSGLSSNASFEKFGMGLEQPTLVVEYSGDQAVFPADLDYIYASIGSSLKTRHRVRGNHHGHPLAAGEESGQVAAGRMIGQWLKESA